MQLSTVTSGRLHPQADIVIPYSLLSHQDRTMWDTIALKQYSMFFMPEVEDFQLCEWSSYDMLFFSFTGFRRTIKYFLIQINGTWFRGTNSREPPWMTFESRWQVIKGYNPQKTFISFFFTVEKNGGGINVMFSFRTLQNICLYAALSFPLIPSVTVKCVMRCFMLSSPAFIFKFKFKLILLFTPIL